MNRCLSAPLPRGAARAPPGSRSRLRRRGLGRGPAAARGQGPWAGPGDRTRGSTGGTGRGTRRPCRRHSPSPSCGGSACAGPGGSSAFRGGLAQNRPTQALHKPVPHKPRLPPARCPPPKEGAEKDARAPPPALGSVFPSQHSAGSPRCSVEKPRH